MSATVATIQSLVRHYSRDNSLDISTSAAALAVTNRIYRTLAAMFPWPELIETVSLGNMATGTEAYAWSKDFLDVQAVEAQNLSNEYCLLVPPPSQTAWNEAGKSGSGMPVYYMRKYDAAEYIYLRPIPGSLIDEKALRVTGVIEPTALASSASTTRFTLSSADDAFAMMIAADWNIHDGAYDLARVNADNAVRSLQQIWDKESITSQILYKILGI
jgi:hypothetical protein